MWTTENWQKCGRQQHNLRNDKDSDMWQDIVRKLFTELMRNEKIPEESNLEGDIKRFNNY